MRRPHPHESPLADLLESCRDEERTRLAREVHDELGPELTALRLDLAWLAPRLAETPPEVRERLADMGERLDALHAGVRRIATDLRTTPGGGDLADQVRRDAHDLARRAGLAIDVTAGPVDGLDPARASALYCMFREAVTNVVRHADAERVTVRVELVDGTAVLEIADDGRGLGAVDPAGLGLRGLRERAGIHGGTVRIGSGRRGGTVVSVALPAPVGGSRASGDPA